MMYGDPQQQQQQQQQQHLHPQQQLQHPQQYQQLPQPPPPQHHPQFGDFPRAPHQQQQPPPPLGRIPEGPPPIMRQPSASSTNIGPPDYHHQPLPQPPHPPYDAQGDSFAAKRIRKAHRKSVDYTSTVVRYVQFNLSLYFINWPRDNAIYEWHQKGMPQAGHLYNHEIRMFQRDSRDRTVLQPTPAAAIDMLPAIAYSDNPSTSFASKFVHASLNKNRCPINRVLWTPSGRRLITGSQSGELTLWNGQSFNFEMILQAHDQAVRSMVWSYSENWMVTGDDGGSIKYWQSSMNNVKAYKSAHKESVRDLSFCRTDLKFCSCSDDTTVKVWDFARCQEERSLSGHGWDVKSVDWHPTKSLLVSGGKDNLVKLWDAKSGKELSSFHGHKNTVLSVKWNQNGNWVLTASKDQIIKLYDIRAMKELESFRGHQKDVTALAWHPFHEEYFVSGSLDGSIFHWLVGHDTPQVEIPNAHDNSVWDLAWHPIGYILCSGSNDHTTKFWCRNRPGDPARDKFNVGHSQGYGEQNPALAGRMPGNFPGTEPPTTPGPFAPGLTRNEGNIPGVGVALPFSIPSFDPSAQGEQRPPPLGVSMPLGAPPLPPGPHPSLLANQQQPYQQQNPQQIHHHQPHPQQLPLPPTNLPQLQPPSHLSMPSHPHLPRNPPQLAPLGMPSSMPGSMPTSLPMPMPSQMGMPGAMNQMVPPFQQGHFMAMNPMQGPSNGSGTQMYQSAGAFNRPQAGPMPPMPGHNPYQTGNPNAAGMGALPSNFNLPSGMHPPLPPGPPPHGQTK